MNEETNEILIEETVPQKETVKKTEVKKKTTKKAVPIIFFNKDTKIEISVDGYHSNETGELQFVLLADKEENKEENKEQEELNSLFTKVNYKFWFSRIPYDRLNRYRTNSMIYNSEDQNNTINQLKLREFFLVFHLLDWNLMDENGRKVELKFDPNKALSDESLKMIYTLPSILIDTVLATFERKMAIS
jgi:hypothetical protein